MTIKNVPAIAMEETTPLGVSNAQRQTPAEVYSAPKSLKVSLRLPSRSTNNLASEYD